MKQVSFFHIDDLVNINATKYLVALELQRCNESMPAMAAVNHIDSMQPRMYGFARLQA
jgi:hypothetical protein